MMLGQLLGERYKISRRIGSGGMADVYLASDTILERDVAIKALRPEYINDMEFVTRFDREAQAATSLSHPNIVSIYDVGEEEEDLYMVMEYIDGMNLKEYIQSYGPLDVEEALDIIKQIASAIAHAHENDIVHRDIKPQNILMDNLGQVKVTDFGIAIALSATSLTQTNSILGSVHYLSPEQARGGTATKKSDIYSIGIVLYELLTGKLPFSGQTPVSIALKHLQNETPSVRRFNQDIPQSVENIILKATAKDPFHRYDTIYALETAIENALDPARINEEIFTPPEEVGDKTRAIPIITNDQMVGAENQETIISKPDNETKAYGANTDEVKNEKTEKAQQPKKKKKRKWLMAFILFLALIFIGFAALFIIPAMLQPGEVVLPDVTDKEFAEVKAELESLELVVEEEWTTSEDVEEGLVISMDPVAGRTVKEQSIVTLTVSEGKELIEMEDYTGENVDQVISILEDLGFSEEIMLLEKHSDEPVDVIIEQIQPNPGQQVIPSETRVIFEVSIGQELISLNNLTGMTESQAKEYLENNGLIIDVNWEHSNNVPRGNIIRQSPNTGTEMAKGEQVTVYISLGQEEIAPSSFTANYTVEYTGATVNEAGEEMEPEEQIIRVYVGDMENNISNVFDEVTITGDTEISFTLLIAPNSNAEYIITRNDEMIASDSISFEEGE